MKKRLLTLLPMLFLLMTAQAQTPITVTSASFPQVNDTLYTVFDRSPYIFILDASANAQNWDFSALLIDDGSVQPIDDASTGLYTDSFPDADIIVPFYRGDGYAKIHTDSVEILGYHGRPVAQVPSYETNTAIDPSHTRNRAGMTYGSIYRDDYGFFIEESGDGIDPAETFGFQVDSVRVDYQAFREDTVDAWGTMVTPHGTFDVIRMKTVEYSDIKVEGKGGFFNWTDLAQFGIGGKDTITQYLWLSATDKEPIAKVELRDNGSNFYCEYKVDRLLAMQVVPTNDIISEKADITAYPNPAAYDVNFKVNQIPAGNYTIELYNIIGRKLASKSVQLSGDDLVRMSVREHSKGVYLYSLVDEQGKSLVTKQLIVVRP